MNPTSRLRRVRAWARQATHLECWGRPISLRLEVRCARSRGTGGYADTPDLVHLDVGSDRVDALVALLHELAHLAVQDTEASYRQMHPACWRRAFAEAIEEVTGFWLPRCTSSYRSVEDYGYAAVLAAMMDAHGRRKERRKKGR